MKKEYIKPRIDEITIDYVLMAGSGPFSDKLQDDPADNSPVLSKPAEKTFDVWEDE